MAYVEHTLTLSNGSGRDVPPEVAASVLQMIGPMVRSSILMAFEGRGSARHRPPKWLQAASDIRFRRATGRDGMVFYFAVPKFGDSASDFYQQGEFWSTRPAADDTGFDLLCDVLRDVESENRDSDLFDDQVLNKLAKFGKVFKLGAEHLALKDRRRPSKRHAMVTSATIDAVQRLTTSTPRPQVVRVVGNLDMIRVSTQRFAVKLDDGAEIPGVFLGGAIQELGALLNKRVRVSGHAVFRPSGNVLRIDADHVVEGANEPSVWSQTPVATRRPIEVRELHKRQGIRTGVAAIIGEWPGDESDEEIDVGLKSIS